MFINMFLNDIKKHIYNIKIFLTIFKCILQQKNFNRYSYIENQYLYLITFYNYKKLEI